MTELFEPARVAGLTLANRLTILRILMTPVIAVRKGNPKLVRSLGDLLRVEVALANPEAAAIG